MATKEPRLKGVIIPLVTPFDRDERIDKTRLRELVDFMITQGPDYLMATALTGEGPLLDVEETLLVWEEVFAAAGRRIGVIPAILSTRTRTAVHLAKAAYNMGAPAVMVAPIVPELYAGRSESDVFQFYADVAATTPLPLILFNYPSLTGVDLTPSFVARLATIETVSYIKESTGDSRRVHAIHRLCDPAFGVICGNPNAAFESLALGCDTWITGIMNVAPKSAKEMMGAIVSRGDLAAARSIYYNLLLPIVDAIATSNNPTGTIKAGLRARGVNVGIPRRPGTDIAAADMNKIRDLVERIGAAESTFPVNLG
jgi:4-hydroxy-tetrahydrodipicolinate synthase